MGWTFQPLLLAAALSGGGADTSLSGSALGSSTCSGSLTTGISLSGTATGTGSASGSLATGIALGGTSSGIGSASGDLTTGISLSGSALGVGSASGALEGGGAALSGSALGTGSAAGSLSTAISLGGDSLGVGTASGGLAGAGADLSGSALGTSTVSGSLDTAISLSGQALGGSSAAGDLSTAITLAGSALGVGAASGSLSGAGDLPPGASLRASIVIRAAPIAVRLAARRDAVALRAASIAPTVVVTFVSNGATFSPLITVAPGAVIEWTFSDGTTSASANPTKDYGTAAARENTLRVTPWSAVTQINVGYTGVDGGDPAIPLVPPQAVSEIRGLEPCAPYLTKLMAASNQLAALDLHDFAVLHTVELYGNSGLASIDLRATPALYRLCVEGCALSMLDISGSPAIGDLRSALHVGGLDSITFPSSRAALWHVCVRNNSHLAPLPDPSTFPALRQWWVWWAHQAGVPTFPASVESILAAGCDYTGAVVPSTVDDVDFSANNFAQAAVDDLLAILAGGAHTNGSLNVSGSGMAAPSATGLGHVATLVSRGWTVTHN